ncbi:MAG: DUF4174 domain-containing protein [Pseudomonadota bacterium]
MASQYYQFLPEWAGLLERDMALVWLGTPNVTAWIARAETEDDVRLEMQKGDIAQSLKKEVACGHGNRGVSLVGKDGGVKKKWPAAVRAEAVFDAVDAMPMRQREMRSD